MASISDLYNLTAGMEGMIRKVTADGTPTLYALGVPALTNMKFSLPSNLYNVSFVSAAACNLMPYGTTPTLASIPVAAATVVEVPFTDMGNLYVHCIVASSGTTLHAIVQSCVAPATP